MASGRRCGPSDGYPSGGSSRKQPKTGPRALALNGLALWTRANSWRGPRPAAPCIHNVRAPRQSAVETTHAQLLTSLLKSSKPFTFGLAIDKDCLSWSKQRFSIITAQTEQCRCEIRQNRAVVNRSDNNTCLDGIIYKKYSSEIKYEQKVPCLDSIDCAWWECYRQWRLIFATILFAWNRLDSRL